MFFFNQITNILCMEILWICCIDVMEKFVVIIIFLIIYRLHTRWKKYMYALNDIFVCHNLHCSTHVYVNINPSLPDPIRREKINVRFHFNSSLWSLKAFIKSFEVPQRSVKTNILVNFYSNTTFWNARGGKG